jgi:hypothetical protein
VNWARPGAGGAFRLPFNREEPTKAEKIDAVDLGDVDELSSHIKGATQ